MFLRFAKKTKISDLKAGQLAVVEGEVQADSLLKLPNTDVKCVYYDVLTEVFRRGDRGAGRKLWMVKGAEQKLAAFSITDGTGRLLVAAEGPEVDLRGAPVEAGMVGSKGTTRFSARVVKPGFVIRLKGLVDEPRRGEPRKGLVLRPGPKGQLILLVRRS